MNHSSISSVHGNQQRFMTRSPIILLIGSSMLHSAVEEFDNINSWALKNNLKIHPSKTKEMIVVGRRSILGTSHRPNQSYQVLSTLNN